MIVYAIHPDMSVEYDNMIDYCIIALQEVIVGVILGAASFFCVQIIQFSGKIIDMDIGISMAQLYDPTTRMTGGYYGQLLLLYVNAFAYNIRYAQISYRSYR